MIEFINIFNSPPIGVSLGEVYQAAVSAINKENKSLLEHFTKQIG